MFRKTPGSGLIGKNGNYSSSSHIGYANIKRKPKKEGLAY